jgi:hypothetical protein
MARWIRLFAVGILAVLLALSSEQSALAFTTLSYDSGTPMAGTFDPSYYYAVKFVLGDFGLIVPPSYVLLRVRYFVDVIEHPATAAIAVFGGTDGKTQLCSSTINSAGYLFGWYEWNLTGCRVVV